MVADLTIYEQVATASGVQVVATKLHDNGDGTYSRQSQQVVADGGNVTIGAKVDPAATDSTSAWSVVALLKSLFVKLSGGLPAALSSAGGLKTDPVTALAGEDFTNDRLGTYVKPADSDSLLETLQNAATATGNGTAVNLKGYKSLTLDITGTFVGTVSFEATIDDSNWFGVAMRSIPSQGTVNSSATTTGSFGLDYTFPNVALSQFRARISGYTSGSITCKTRKHAR